MKKSFSATFDNLKNIRSMLVDFLNNHKLQVKEIKEIELGTDEAVTNIIKHSYKEENKKNIIELELEFSENKVIIHLYDNGTPGNEKKIKPRELSDVKPGGLGTYFMNKIIFNGKILKEENLMFNQFKRAVNFGDGFFETIRVINGKEMFFEDHFTRIKSGLNFLKID